MSVTLGYKVKTTAQRRFLGVLCLISWTSNKKLVKIGERSVWKSPCPAKITTVRNIFFIVKSQDVTSRFSLASFLYQSWVWKSDFLTKISLLWTVTQLLTTYSRVQTDINIFLSQLLHKAGFAQEGFFSHLIYLPDKFY